MNIKEAINNALERDVDLTREEYAEKRREADEITAAHGVKGEAPLTEEERERRMRMNYYGTMLNVSMSVLAALDDIADKLTTINNNIVILGGGDIGECNSASGD